MLTRQDRENGSDDSKAYLRDILIKYLATTEERAKHSIEAAIATVLRLTPEEMEFIRKKRKESEPMISPLKSNWLW